VSLDLNSFVVNTKPVVAQSRESMNRPSLAENRRDNNTPALQDDDTGAECHSVLFAAKGHQQLA
jgi:hypothetical protein